MTQKPFYYLAELTWPEAQRVRDAQAVVLLPVGATEAHGPHLPLGTDVYLSEALAKRAAQTLSQQGVTCVIAPSLAYAVTEFGAPFAGTVSLDPDAATALYTAVCAGLHRSGFERVCIVNSHLEAAHVTALRAATAAVFAKTGRRVAFADNTERRWARTLTDEFKRGTCHAGSYETSLLLAAQPQLVRSEVARALPENESDFLAAVKRGAGTFPDAGGPQAYFGQPATASLAEGEDTYERLVAMVVATIQEAWPALFSATSPVE
jgi:creatinine amidohydrolase